MWGSTLKRCQTTCMSKNGRVVPSKRSIFKVQAFLDSAGVSRKIVEYQRGDVIFAQGDPCEHVMFIQKGNVKLSVLSKSGPGSGCRPCSAAGSSLVRDAWPVSLSGWEVRPPRRPATILLIDRIEMVRPSCTSSMPSPIDSSRTCWHGISASRRT